MELIGWLSSLVMGLVLGLMGGGGSIMTVPILVYLFRIPPVTATGYSLFIVGLTALIGGLMYVRKGDYNLKVGLIFALPSMIGVSLSRQLLVPSLPDVVFQTGEVSLSKNTLIMAVFAVLMVTASVSMIRKKKPQSASAITPATPPTLLIATQGLMVGIIAGFVGAGGGFLIIPALVLLARLPMRIAVGTSLIIIAFQSLSGFAGDAFQNPDVDWLFLLKVAALAVIGIASGSLFSHKIQEQKLKTAFGWFVLLMGTTIFLEQLRHL